MKHKIKGGIIEAAMSISLAGVFLTVGAVENFSISIGRGAVIVTLCAALAIAAVCAGCKEEN